MIRQLASVLICTSPVSRPTSNLVPRSRNFWLLIALTGAVYTAFVLCSSASAKRVLCQHRLACAAGAYPYTPAESRMRRATVSYVKYLYVGAGKVGDCLAVVHVSLANLVHCDVRPQHTCGRVRRNEHALAGLHEYDPFLLERVQVEWKFHCHLVLQCHRTPRPG